MKSVTRELIPLTFEPARDNPIKLAYKLYQPDDCLKLTASASTFDRQTSMPAVLVTEHITTQNSPFLPQWWPKPTPVLDATEG